MCVADAKRRKTSASESKLVLVYFLLDEKVTRAQFFEANRAAD